MELIKQEFQSLDYLEDNSIERQIGRAPPLPTVVAGRVIRSYMLGGNDVSHFPCTL